MSVLAVTPGRGAGEIHSAPVAASNTAEKLSALDLAGEAWSDGDIARFLDRRSRLLRWGWPEPEAEALADRLARRDQEADPRVNCIDCRHYRPGRCGNHRCAGLNGADVGRDLAAMLQRCPGFATRENVR